ncbi:GTPase domain-containing protein [Salinibacterium sp. G-O1]|uniref:dynamin family protein n=1 Tax=Salinibacterium sp. G-O1 TaxID=3046208 RepID=UPI0024BBC899|nr:GTPase domain-containing protein [Salinibacterium sp. G-O1]MDJ0334215.1 GTPase domain-containing protein [Salinibacterium sp. G-O1]
MTDTRAPALDSLERLRASLADAGLSLPLDGAAAQRDAAAAAVRQIDDYIRPRLANLDAPLLAVVGGSTGSGKSTIVNALIGTPTTRAGVIRPTTRQPILVHAPVDAGWFATDRILPGLARVRGSITAPGTPASSAGDAPTADRINELMLLAHDKVPMSLAIIDAPDIDSVADDNRALAAQLLAAADLWLFVTTANRYADAVPWALLDGAASRNITVAVVLNRVPPGAAGEVLPDLQSMLTARGLADAPVFVIEEQPLDALGMLPAEAVADPRGWLTDIASDRAERTRIAARTLRGAIVDLDLKVASIAAARQHQLDWLDGTATAVAHEYSSAADAVDEATRDGALLRGEVLARWQDFVGTSDVFRKVERWFSRARDSATAWVMGRPQPVIDVEVRIEHGLHAVIVDQAGRAAAASWASLQRSEAGRMIAEAHPELGTESDGFGDRAAAMIREWQGALLRLIQDNAGSKRVRARVLSAGLNVVTVALMIVVFASTGGLTGGEIAIAGGSAVLGQKLLETIFGEDAVRRLAGEARTDLTARVDALFATEAARVTAALDSTRFGSSPGALRRESAALLSDVRTAGESGGTE